MLSAVLITAVAACAGRESTPEDLAGTFVDDDGGMLTLHDDGTYQLAGVPAGVLDGDDGDGDPDAPNLTGAWDLPPDVASSDFLMLDVETDDSGAYPYGNIQIWIASTNRLYVYANGVDHGPLHYFERIDRP
jgi:hypothetical protein